MEERKTIIDLKKIVKRFYIGSPNELEILHGIDLKVKEGEFVSIVGSSGSGKTTMMNIIGVLDRATEGEYMLDGVDVAQAKDKELSHIRNQKIGFVFQTYNLISQTSALKNVELPMLYAAVGKKNGQNGQKCFWKWWVWRSVWRTIRMNCPEDRSSAWRSPAPWQMIRPSFWPTNLPARWIPKPDV